MSHNVRKHTFRHVPKEDSNQPAHTRSLNSFHGPHEETFHPWLSEMHPVKIVIGLHKCVG